MKRVLSFLGVVFLAQLMFVGFVHVFLIVEGKNSPETLASLSRLPVIGGFFPEPPPSEKIPNASEQQDLDVKRILAEGDELFRLPREFSAEEVRNHIDSATRTREKYEEMIEELRSEMEALEVRNAQIQSDQEELTQRIETLAKLEKDLEARWQELEAKQRIIAEEEAKSFGRLGEIYAKMSSEKAAAVLSSMKPQEAAMIMETIEPRYQGKIFNAMETPIQVDIQKYMLKPAFRPAERKTDTGPGED